MTSFEVASIILSIVAIIVSIIAYRKADTTASRSNQIALGSLEFYINERITNTKDKVSEISLQMATIMPNEEKLSIYEKVMMVAIENNINAYEAACASYLDGKVDGVRFEKLYKVEIRQLVEDPNYKEYFDAVTTKYKAILKVYNKWENLEK